jgi:hypothetical protein
MLIKSTAQFRQYVPITALTKYDTLKPYISEAEVKVIKDIVGTELYAQLDAVEGDSTAKEAELLMLLRSSVANLAIYYGFDFMNVQLSETGYSRSSGDKSLYRYQEENLKDGSLHKGFAFLDMALTFLYNNLDTFDKFKTSTYYLSAKSDFFKTTAEFTAIYPMGGSRLVFTKIAGYFGRVIDFDIIPVMGQPLYDALIIEMQKDTGANTDLMALVPYVRKALAYLAISRGCYELNYNITDKGMIIERQVAVTNSHIETSPIDAESLDVLRRSTNTIGTSYLNKLMAYLSQNRDKYPQYLQNITTTNPYRRENTGKKTLWL